MLISGRTLQDEYALAPRLVRCAKSAVQTYGKRFEGNTGAGAWMHDPDNMLAGLLAPHSTGHPQRVAKQLVDIISRNRAQLKDKHNRDILLDKQFGEQCQRLARTGTELEFSMRERIMWRYVCMKLTSMFAESTFSMQKSSFLRAIASQIEYSSRQCRRMSNSFTPMKESWLQKGGMFREEWVEAKRRHPWHKKNA